MHPLRDRLISKMAAFKQFTTNFEQEMKKETRVRRPV